MEHGAAEGHPELQEHADEPIARAVAVIRERYNEPLSLSYLASVAGLSKFYFCRRFQGEVGSTPVQFLISVRMQEAGHLLESTALSIGEITRRVGYSSVGTFTTRFTALFGVAPNRYRIQRERTSRQASRQA
ncbi:AraC family transcriptional regulator [Streptomyces sp. NPDC002088]|uniref:AraC family transcriptional regulator n=1 Tax=Streptomyces sp. NPDC002088 TaxID=3154665 RepID=UPI00332FBFA4